jgi:hypothetical protein
VDASWLVEARITMDTVITEISETRKSRVTRPTAMSPSASFEFGTRSTSPNCHQLYRAIVANASVCDRLPLQCRNLCQKSQGSHPYDIARCAAVLPKREKSTRIHTKGLIGRRITIRAIIRRQIRQQMTNRSTNKL